jgi:hypothetical protein
MLSPTNQAVKNFFQKSKENSQQLPPDRIQAMAILPHVNAPKFSFALSRPVKQGSRLQGI